MMHGARPSGGAAALPGTVAEAAVRAAETVWALHMARMWTRMDTQYLGRTGGEELGVSCFT